MSLDATYPSYFSALPTTFTVGNTTLAKVVVDVNQPLIMPVLNGEVPIPGESAVRQRIRTGGCRVIDGSITSTDGTARSILYYLGTQTSLYSGGGTVPSLAAMGTVTVTSSTITRTTGSFITEGYLVGDLIMTFGSLQTGNNGLLSIVTGVAAQTLTVNGTSLSAQNPEGAGFRIFTVGLLTRKGIPLSSGNTDAAPPVPLLGGSQDPARAALPDAGLSLGENDALIMAMVANVSALPAYVAITPVVALY